MIYKLAPHIHLQSEKITKNPSVKEVLDFFSDYDIIILVVHSPEVTKKFYSSFVKECEKHSTSKKLIIPCLEDESRKYHLLLVGAVAHPKYIFNPNREYLTVLAHPQGYGRYKMKIQKEDLNLEELDGVEVWNLIHNSKKYPSLKTLKFLKKLPKKIKAYIGLDYHPPFKKPDSAIFVNCRNLKKELVIKALKEGEFYNQIKDFSLSSKGELKENGKTINNNVKMKCLTHDCLIHSLSLLTYIGNKTLDLFNIKEHQKYKIIRIVKWIRRKL